MIGRGIITIVTTDGHPRTACHAKAIGFTESSEWYVVQMENRSPGESTLVNFLFQTLGLWPRIM